MVTPELLDFVRVAHESCMRKEEVEQVLLGEGGWTKADVAEAFTAVFPDMQEPRQSTPILPTTIVAPAIAPIVKEETQTRPVAQVPPPVVTREVAQEVALPAVSPTLANKTEAPARILEVRPAPSVQFTASASAEKKVERGDMEEEKPINISVSPSEDFLGIFSAFRTPAPKSTLPQATVIISPRLPQEEVKRAFPKPEPQPLRVTPPATPASTLPSTEPAKESTSTPSVSAPVTTTPTRPFAPPTLNAESASVFKFDFAKMRSTQATQPVEENSAKTVGQPSATGHSITMTKEERADKESELRERDADRVTQHEKSTLVGRRTMAGDLLLRGLAPATSVAPTAPIPPTSTLPVIPPPDAVKEKPQVTSMPVQVFDPARPKDELMQKNMIKRILGFAVGALVLLALGGGGIYAYFKLRGPDLDAITTSALAQFFETSTFSYKGNGAVDLSLTGVSPDNAKTSIANIGMEYGGQMKNSATGYGDGLHHLKLSGEVGSNGTKWPISMEADMRLIGTSLYLHALTLPPTSNLDPELGKTYWIKIDLSEIAQQLVLSGVAASEEGYGNFGGQNSDNTFNALLKKNTPFRVSEQLPDETINGVLAYHLKMEAVPEPMLQLATELYRKYLGKELVLTPDKRIRLRDALAKLSGDLWVSKDTFKPMRVSLAGNFDDDMFDTHVKGSAKLLIGLSDLNGRVVADVPSPVLTLEELKVQMDQYEKNKEIRHRDGEKVTRLKGLSRALESYNTAKGRFPTTLPELYGAGILATTSVPETTLSAYAYAAYLSATPLSKANRCTMKGKVCAYYHIGVNLEDATGPLLTEDNDVTSDVRGEDGAGCSGEKGFACYDYAGPKLATSTTNI